ncbi:MAG: tRNA 2-thiouridine(34) synthase MnmA [Flavobacteriaceae bacterium]|nr:tRNA 2-thiouridine(34) synthase MnmA [Flavobacteriaceae bacterium]MDG2063098.1 tRNA 2-thiouridine(34) synthase MnmA [Flavobacteriaceae bacterium]
MKSKKVFVGLSGGVDSSVAAYLLKEVGYEVVGLFMKNWHDESVTLSNECPWLEDSNDAMLVAEKLGIPFQTVDLSKEYKERIVDYMFDEYSKGRTPNPDVLCNREIKFDVFLKIALSLGADFVATGHYCQKSQFTDPHGKDIHQLIAGIDTNKDQSYFLCQLSQEQLSKVLFPIGHLQKTEVRKIAKTQNLITADKKDSQGLCFIGKVSLPDFLQKQLKPSRGEIIEISSDFETYNTVQKSSKTIQQQSNKQKYSREDGLLVGEHNGAHFFTVGQRKGLKVGGMVEPLFVIDTDVDTNTIYVGQGKQHPGLYREALKINKVDIHWIRNDLSISSGETLEVLARIRYRQPLQKARLYQTEKGMYLLFKLPQSSIASGQFVAWYQDDELLGSGVIS